MVSASKSLMSPVIDKLTGLLGDEYKLVKSVKGGIEFLRRELSTMDAALERLAGMEEQIDEQTKEWRNKVRELSYDIEDCIDRFVHRHSLGDAKAYFVKQVCTYGEDSVGDRWIAKEIQELKARVVEECERRKRYNIDQLITSPQPVPLDPRAPALYEEARNLVGIDGPREEIIGWLKDDEKQLKVVSIFGVGGLGKTTLAMEVYHKIDESFHYRASVSVSRTPHIKKLLRDILFQINKKEYEKSENWEMEQLIHTLREKLKDKRYFVIVDDIWSIEAWEHLKSAFPVNNNRSRIITTTRIKSVADSCCTGIVGHMYEAKPLDEGDSRRLFFRRIFGSSEDCPQELTEVANEIMRKCGGLPLAILSIASLLASKSQRVEVWMKIWSSISSAVEKDSPFDKMKRILLLSYFDLPHQLKDCLLYLSVFPEDYSIDGRRLIWRWVAEGLIPGQNRESMEQLGEGYLNVLINRSMIQLTKTEEDGITVKSCRVHDIIHDFIISQAIEENFANISNGNDFCGNSTNKIRRLSLQPNYSVASESEMPKAMNLDHLRSLHMYGSCSLHQMVDSSRSHLRSHHSIPVPQLLNCQVLRVLNIEDTNLKNCHLEHIGSFSLLKHLRITGSLLTGTSISKLPEQIGNLQYLEILDVGASCIHKLPATIVQLQKLVRLFVHTYVRLPDGIGNLRALEELSVLGIYKASVSSMQGLGELTKLRTLEVDWGRSEEDCDLEGHEEVFISSLFKLVAHSLQSLHVRSFESSDFIDSWVFSRGSSPPLQRLVLEAIPNFAFPNIPSQIGSLANLTCLSINHVGELGEEGVKILSSLPALLSLTLSRGYGVRQGHVIVSQGFQRLVELNFCGDRCLMFEPGAMPKLRRMRLKLTHREQYQPGGLVQGLHHLSSLKHISIRLCYTICDEGSSEEALEHEIRGATSIHPNRPILEFI